MSDFFIEETKQSIAGAFRCCLDFCDMDEGQLVSVGDKHECVHGKDCPPMVLEDDGVWRADIDGGLAR